MRMVRVREKVFRNSSGFRFNAIFVDCTSAFVKSVLEASLSFTYTNQFQKREITQYFSVNNTNLPEQRHSIQNYKSCRYSQLDGLTFTVYTSALNTKQGTTRFEAWGLKIGRRAPGVELKVLAPYWYLISRVFNFAFLAIAKKSQKNNSSRNLSTRNRPFARCRHFTTTTRILSFSFHI